MPARRRFYRRSQNTRPVKPLFVIACEGGKTEPDYFRQFGGSASSISIKLLPCAGKSPSKLLGRMRQYIHKYPLASNAEAWIVLDRDQWPPDELDRVSTWARAKSQYGLALSNPKFEYWLLLHFEEGHRIGSAQECVNRLRKYLPQYRKSIGSWTPTRDQIQQAIRRAKLRDKFVDKGWPNQPGSTTYTSWLRSL